MRHRDPQAGASLSAGDRIDGRYEITGRLAAGGCATVYLARQAPLGRTVAVKVMGVAGLERDDEASSRFAREAWTAASLSHPNIPAVYDAGWLHDGTPWIAMELVDGRPLSRVLREDGPLAMPRVVSLFTGALDALAMAHDAGITHRDVKPCNLVIAGEGTPRERLVILDFGISHVDGLMRLTDHGDMIGSTRYLAPEYVRLRAITPAGDIYQAGLAAMEAMTGRKPVPGRHAAEWLVQISRGVELPKELQNTAMGACLAKAVALHPADRYSSAAEFAAALGRVRPSQAQPPPIPLNQDDTVELPDLTDPGRELRNLLADL